MPRLPGLRYRDSAGIAILLNLQLRPQQIPALVAALHEGSGGRGAEGFTLDAGEAVKDRPVAAVVEHCAPTCSMSKGRRLGRSRPSPKGTRSLACSHPRAIRLARLTTR